MALNRVYSLLTIAELTATKFPQLSAIHQAAMGELLEIQHGLVAEAKEAGGPRPAGVLIPDEPADADIEMGSETGREGETEEERETEERRG